MASNDCPKCRTSSLQPLQSARGVAGLADLPARCRRCHGFWVKLTSVAALQESGAMASIDEDELREESDRRTGVCPEGHGILARAKASWKRPFYVERCLTCAGLWLDAGEWKRLGAEHLLERLEVLWLPTWRKEMQHQHQAARLREHVVKRLGQELTEKIDALAVELAAHPHGDLGLAVLQEVFDAKRPRRRER